MKRFLRPPSVAEYDRMTQRLRLEAAELLVAQIAEMQRRRDALAARSEPMPPAAVAAVEHSPAETRDLAQILLARLQHLYPEHPSVKAQRLEAALAEMDRTWTSGGRGGQLKAAS